MKIDMSGTTGYFFAIIALVIIIMLYIRYATIKKLRQITFKSKEDIIIKFQSKENIIDFDSSVETSKQLDKNKWLNPTDEFGKLEKGKV